MQFEYRREQILEAVCANHKRHVKQHEGAMIAWRLDAARYFMSVREAAEHLRNKASKDKLTSSDLPYRFGDVDAPEAPDSYSYEYEVAIQMLELSTNETIQMDEAEFRRYMCDQWDWRADFDLRIIDYRRRYSDVEAVASALA